MENYKPLPEYPKRGDVVVHKSDPKRNRGTIVEVHPFGEFRVKWERWSRSELVLFEDLAPWVICA